MQPKPSFLKRARPGGFWQGVALAFGSTAALVVLATLPPFLPETARWVVMEAFSGICHQIPERSPHIGDVALGVCHRCYGVYLGLAAAGLLFGSARGFWPFSGKMAPYVLLAAASPALIDWTGEIVGLWSNTPGSRMITGGFLGLVAGYFLVSAIVDSFVARSNRARNVVADAVSESGRRYTELS